MRRIFFIAALFFLAKQNGFARELLNYGNGGGGASLGIVTDDSIASLFHNPAMLNSTEKMQWQEQVRLTALQFEYRHPEYSPYRVHIFAPPLLAGASLQLSHRWTLGLMLVPKGVGTTTKMTGLPIDIAKDDSILSHIKANEWNIQSGVGVKYLAASQWQWGLSLLGEYKNTKLLVESTDGERAVAKAKYQGSHVRPVTGLLWQNDVLDIAFSYAMPSAFTQHGKANTPDLSVDAKRSISPVTYYPHTLGVGFLKRFEMWSPFIEYEWEYFSAGRNIARQDISETDPKETNLIDAHNVALGFSVKSESHSISTSIAYNPKSVGSGRFSGDGGKDNAGITGARFGDMNMYDCLRFGAAWRFLQPEHRYYEISSQLLYGTAHVPHGRPQQGDYRARSLALGFAASH